MSVKGLICGCFAVKLKMEEYKTWNNMRKRIPFFSKRWRAWKGAADFVGDKMVPGSTRKSRLLDGREWNQLPWVKE